MVCMTHRTFQLTAEAASALQAAEHATRDAAYRTRLQAVRLYGLGYPTVQITEITGAPCSSLMLWCRTYRTGGIAALDDQRVGGNSAKLTRDQVADLSRKLRQYPPQSLCGPEAAPSDGQAWRVADLQRAVTFWYGVTYQSVVSYDNLFARCDYSYYQPAKVFKSRNEAAVTAFEPQIKKTDGHRPNRARDRHFGGR
jgi:transposase